MNISLSEQVAQIRALSEPERDAFNLVCVNQDCNADPAMLKSLLKKGLVAKGRGGYQVVSYWVHYAWCIYCQEEFDKLSDAEKQEIERDARS